MLFQHSSTIAIALLGLACTGCGGGAIEVSGKVLVDGQPLPEGRIALRPKTEAKDVRTVKTVVSNGEFAFARNQGIASGDYSVVITGRRKSGQSIPAEEGSGEVVERYEQYLPRKYNSSTELTVHIDSDQSDLNFELELPKRR